MKTDVNKFISRWFNLPEHDYLTWEGFGVLKESSVLEIYFGVDKFKEILLESIKARNTPKYFLNKIYNEITNLP